ncbi:hypothetical protein CI610_01700 [invertebrate metagenome]|uniref:Serpin domain-containing protein n=1 Tax=invertebrate metagenome TaxID=1711999 RepID=A0A2H9T860_9ZZZZ
MNDLVRGFCICGSDTVYGSMDSEKFRLYVNNLILNSTENKIRNFLTCPLDQSIQVCLINTILLKAKWPDKLDLIQEFLFFDCKEQCSKTPAVKYKNGTGCKVKIKNIDWTVSWLPFKDLDYGVVLAMPEINHKDCFSQSGIFNEVLKVIESVELMKPCHSTFPKLKVESTWDDLVFVMSQANLLRTAFNPTEADFGLLSEDTYKGSSFYISMIIQKAIIELDEFGVQAAAATGVGGMFGGRRIERPRPEYHFDKPFKLFIVYKPSGTMIFETTIVNAPEQPMMQWSQ